jgi:sulfite exporter TauE/SafE
MNAMLISAVLLGLMGSFHCVGMCGPIAFMLPVDRTNNLRKFGQISIYHLGRLLAYGIIGLVFGILGKGLYLFGIQQKLSIIIGIVMVVIAMIPYKIFNRYNFTRPIMGLISKVKNQLGLALKKRGPDTFLSIGFLNGFLPCGLVYMGLLGALGMGDALKGMLFMVLFGLGTIPLMTSAIYFSGMLKSTAKQRIQRLVPVFVVFVGILFIVRGLGLGIPYLSPKPVRTLVSAQMECHD